MKYPAVILTVIRTGAFDMSMTLRLDNIKLTS